MKQLLTLVRVSLLEFMREKIVWICLFIAVALIALSFLLGALSFQEKQRILAHFGWLAIQLSSLGISLFLGSYWLHNEMDRQTCLLILARPIARDQFLLGKFLGVISLSFIIQFSLAFALLALLQFDYNPIYFAQIFMGTFFESTIICALCFLAATFLQPVIALLFGVAFFLVGHWTQEVEFFGRKIKNAFFMSMGQTFQWLSPNLYQMNWRSVYFLENGVSSKQLVWVGFHSLGWILFALCLAIFIFRRKDLV